MQWANAICNHKLFQQSITAIIIINAVVIGLDTSPELTSRYGVYFEWANWLCLLFFIAEAGIKLLAHYPKPHRYFYDGWNIFDFSIIVASLIPAGGQLATLARLARLLRVLRLISSFPELRLIVNTLIRSIPSMMNVILLMSIIFYVYAVAGYHFFHAIDPTHWRNLGIALLTLFRIVTLEDWTDVMYAAMDSEPWAWMYFVSFVVMGTFVVVNLFIAVVLNNLDKAKTEQLEALNAAPSRDEILRELRATQEALQSIRSQLERLGEAEESALQNGDNLNTTRPDA
ncbi:MAG TPA: ion transporter [Gammaproteobacteria bacterium]|nr:ion transporter [Gammaproteobacteria bacterium]|tara:strand:- start:7223 stop:8080 length:858 start_codon:yes stop_codon:yes gene_type:complete